MDLFEKSTGKPDVSEENIAEEEYTRAKKRRHSLRRTLWTLLIFAQLGFVAVAFWFATNENLWERTYKELSHISDGEIKFQTGVYSGETDFGLIKDNGTFVFNDGSSYTGQWKDEKFSELGTLNIPDVGQYTGNFSAGQKNGEGTFTWEDGAEYIGMWESDTMSGDGTYTTADGVVYTGTFSGNRFTDGECTFQNDTGKYKIKYKNGTMDTLSVTYPNGTTYSGGCSADGLSGTGKMNFPNGDTYSGTFSCSVRAGSGAYTWVSGSSYSGEWKDDKMNGTGRYVYADGSEVSGTFESNAFVSGTYTFVNDFGSYSFTIKNSEPVAVKMVLADGTVYDGGLSDGKLTGTAQITYSNGDTYSGAVIDGVKSGSGNYHWASGASYDGRWSEDQMNGTGTYYYPKDEDGFKLSGTFKNGKPVDCCSYYTNASTYYKTDWAYGRCVKIYE